MAKRNKLKWVQAPLGFALSAAMLSVSAQAFAQTAPNFQTDGFPTVVQTAVIQPTEAPTTVSAGPVSIAIPTGAFGSAPVKFELLEGPTSALTPTGTTPVADFAFKVINESTGALVVKFAKPVTASITASTINAASEYWDVAPNGALSLNPIAPTITNDTLSHKILAAAVGWVVTNPVAAPNFTQDGFPTVIGSTSFTPGTAATVSGNGITVSIPANAFNIPVTVQLLQGPEQNFIKNLPAGQRFVTDFALKVTDTATHQLVKAFNAPVVATITNSQINAKSEYLDVAPNGAIEPNPIAPVISGDTLKHGIAAAAVGWVVTSPAVVAKATSPVTGLPIAPMVAVGAGLVAAGAVVLRKRAPAQR